MLCFGCLRHVDSSRKCYKRLSCTICNRFHPTVLQDDSYSSRQRLHQPPQSNSYQRNAAALNYNNRPPQSYFKAPMPLRFQNNNQATNSLQKSTPQPAQKSTTSMNMNIRQLSVSQHISSMIVPVYLSHRSCPGQRKLVYAMLDSQSDSSFIIDQTLNSFAVATEETVICQR